MIFCEGEMDEDLQNSITTMASAIAKVNKLLTSSTLLASTADLA
jgi:hypothetical protein